MNRVHIVKNLEKSQTGRVGPEKLKIKSKNAPGKYTEKWIRLKLPEYKGTADPETQVVKFISNMEDVTDHQDLWCRMFVKTLEEKAMNWYVDLPSNTIG